MASFEIEGLAQWKRSAILWGLIGLVGAIASLPPPWLIGLSLVLGLAAAAISLALAYRNKGRFSIIATYAALAALVGLAWNHDGGLSGLASLSLGALFLSAEAIASGLLGQRVL